MAVKAVNDTTRPNGLILTLLVFGAFLRLTKWDLSASGIQKQALAIYNAMEEVYKFHTHYDIQEALRLCNSPRMNFLYKLLINSKVMVYKEYGY